MKDAIILGQNYGLNGILSVINIKIPPQELYDEVKKLKVKGLNILLPDGHFDQLPDGLEKEWVNTKIILPMQIGSSNYLRFGRTTKTG